jgi:hypothetical protein
MWAEFVLPSQAQGYLFYQTSTATALSCMDYETITETIVTPETLLQLQWHRL